MKPRTCRGFNVDARIERLPEAKLHVYRYCDGEGCKREHQPLFLASYNIPPEGKTRAQLHLCRADAEAFAARNGCEVPA